VLITWKKKHGAASGHASAWKKRSAETGWLSDEERAPLIFSGEHDCVQPYRAFSSLSHPETKEAIDELYFTALQAYYSFSFQFTDEEAEAAKIVFERTSSIALFINDPHEDTIYAYAFEFNSLKRRSVFYKT
jgi:hypothetical protein